MLTEIITVLVVGYVAGLFGSQVGGAGLLTLPALFLLGLPAPIAIGTNRFAALFLTGSATFQYHKNNKIRIEKVMPFAVIGLIGSMIGAQIVMEIDEILLTKILIGILILLLVILAFEKDMGLKDHKFKPKGKGLFLFAILSLIIGIYSGFVGVATVTFFCVLFVFFGQSFTQAMGYSIFLAFIFSIGSTAIFAINDAIFYQLAIPMAIGEFAGARTGARFAIKHGNGWIRCLFIIIALVFIGKMLIDIL